MALNLVDLLIAAVLVGVGCVLTYVTLHGVFRHAISDLQLSTDRQLNELAGVLKELETRVGKLSSELSRSTAMAPASVSVTVPVAKAAATDVGEKVVGPRKHEEVTPEMLVVMAAAVTAFLGKKVRLRSAKMLQSPYEIVNPWSQQGRVFVQASHNLRSPG